MPLRVSEVNELNFKLKPPFKVLLDGEFIQAALEGKILLKEQIPKLLQDDRSEPYVTKCILKYLEIGGGFYSGAAKIAKTLRFLSCRHEKGSKPPNECIELQVAGGNKDRLIIGSQDLELRSKLREAADVPFLFIRGNVPIMEPPKGFLQTLMVQRAVAAKTQLSEKERALVDKSKAKPAGGCCGGGGSGGGGSGPPRKKRKRGPKEPNPLSVKKKKKGVQQGEGKGAEKKGQKQKGASSGSGTDKDKGQGHGKPTKPTKNKEMPRSQPKRTAHIKQHTDTHTSNGGVATGEGTAGPPGEKRQSDASGQTGSATGEDQAGPTRKKRKRPKKRGKTKKAEELIPQAAEVAD
eukprot:g67280.t1